MRTSNLAGTVNKSLFYLENDMKSMNAVSVEENVNGDIEISQPSPFTESGLESIIVTKEQVPIIINWLNEVIQ